MYLFYEYNIEYCLYLKQTHSRQVLIMAKSVKYSFPPAMTRKCNVTMTSLVGFWKTTGQPNQGKVSVGN